MDNKTQHGNDQVQTDNDIQLKKEPVDNIDSLLKKWIYNDYITPKYKAEVIIDTLISEFIEDMFDHFIGKEEDAKDAKLLAKEFPIDPDNRKNGNRSPAVDYLVAKGTDLYLVELKTDDASFRDSQLNRMCKVSGENKAADLFYHYINVIVATEEKKKYRAQFRHIWFKLTGEKLDLDDSQITEYGLNKVICKKNVESDGNNNKIPETIKKDFENRSVKIAYLTLNENQKVKVENGSVKIAYLTLNENQKEKVENELKKLDYSEREYLKREDIKVFAIEDFEYPDKESDRTKLWNFIKGILSNLPVDNMNYKK